MIRATALAFAFLLAGAASAAAQTHHGSHARTHPPDHHPPVPHDSAHHAALHALVHGSWTGTLHPAHGEAGAMHLSIGRDSHGAVSFAVRAPHAGVGAARGFMLRGDTLHWTQDVAGAPCATSAVVRPATPRAPGTMTGTIACERGTLGFTLRKTAD
jgi:hypothetical protein